jgi:hypothetical protein
MFVQSPLGRRARRKEGNRRQTTMPKQDTKNIKKQQLIWLVEATEPDLQKYLPKRHPRASLGASKGPQGGPKRPKRRQERHKTAPRAAKRAPVFFGPPLAATLGPPCAQEAPGGFRKAASDPRGTNFDRPGVDFAPPWAMVSDTPGARASGGLALGRQPGWRPEGLGGTVSGGSNKE